MNCKMFGFLIGLALTCPVACSQPDGDNDNTNGNDNSGNANDNTTVEVPDGFPPAARVDFDAADRLIVDGEIDESGEVIVYDVGPLGIGDFLDVQCIARTGSDLDPMMALFDRDGFRVFWNDDINPGTSNFDSAFDGYIRHDSNYFLAVASTSFFSTEGSFRCTVERMPEVGVAAILGQTVVINLEAADDVTVSGINYGDLDEFSAATIGDDFTDADTEALLDRILEIVGSDFAPFDLTLLTSDDVPPAGKFSRVFLGSSSQGIPIFGIADDIDFYNGNDMDEAIVFMESFDGLTSNLDATAQAIANVISHEIGHTLGLMHTNDVTELMDTTGADVTLLDDQSFGVAEIVDFPIGRQNSPLLLEETIGRAAAAKGEFPRDGQWRCGTCGATLHFIAGK